MTDWQARCVLHAARGVDLALESGHVCPACRVRIDDDLQAILRLVDDAAEWIELGRTGGSRRPAPGSRPPLNVEALDPAYADARVFDRQIDPPTVTELLIMWERLIREMRGFSAEHSLFLIDVVPFLRAQLDWITTEPTFPVEDFANEVTAAARPLRRYDMQAEEHEPTSIVFCPTIDDNGATCGRRLVVHRWTARREGDPEPDPIRCRKCGVERRPAQLVNAVGIDDAYVPAQLAAEHLGIAASTIREWAAQGHVKRQGSVYRYGDVRMHHATRRKRQDSA